MEERDPSFRSGAGRIHSRLAGDPDMAELVMYFVSELGERVQAISRALEAEDRTTVRRIAHQLKGAAGGYGFEIIGQAASQLEDATLADEADLSHVRELTEHLIGLCRRVTTEPA